MKHLRSINQKAGRVDRHVQKSMKARSGVVALQGQGPPQQPSAHVPMGCTLIFSPGWETDRNGGTAGLCSPVERDLFDCYTGCFWPAQVPDHLNYSPDWTSTCAAAAKDWRKIDLVFP